MVVTAVDGTEKVELGFEIGECCSSEKVCIHYLVDTKYFDKDGDWKKEVAASAEGTEVDGVLLIYFVHI